MIKIYMLQIINHITSIKYFDPSYIEQISY